LYHVQEERQDSGKTAKWTVESDLPIVYNISMTWQSSEESALLAVQRRAMSDDFEVTFSRQEFPQGTEAALDALDEVDRIERLISVFRLDSQVH
jgi:hypothetical protein